MQLSETVNSLLSLRVIPIFNENDAIRPGELHMSGYAIANIMKLQGEKIGTIFQKDAHLWDPTIEIGARDMAVAARESSRKLQGLSSEDRRKILLDIADALEEHENLIVLDVVVVQLDGYEKALISRLALKLRKIASLAKSVRVLADMEEPIGLLLKKTELAEGLTLEKEMCHLGVLLVVFESWPDALVQVPPEMRLFVAESEE